MRFNDQILIVGIVGLDLRITGEKLYKIYSKIYLAYLTICKYKYKCHMNFRYKYIAY